MSQNVTFNGVVYSIPAVGDDSWGQNLFDFLVAIPQGVLQKSGGNFTLSANINFGANFGILSKFFSTRSVNPAASGLYRLSLADTIAWRNNANSSDLALGINGSDQLSFNGNVLQIAGNYITALTGDVTASGPGSVAATIGSNKVLNTMIRQSAALSLIGRAANSVGNVADITAATDNTVLLRSGTSLVFNLLTNNNIDPAAAIAYTKLALTGNIVNADISATAAIAYAKLALTGSILNADISGSAAIAYSKLNLSAAIVNADISASAAIAHTKMAALTASRALVSDGSGIVAVSAATATELSYLSGVTSAIQTQLGAKAGTASPTFTGTITTPLTASRALVTGAASELAVSAVTATELGYLSGVTSALQTQISAKVTNPLTTTGDMIYSSSGSTLARLGIGSSGQVIKSIGGVPAWSTFSGGINYASGNPDAEADVSGWATYADGAAVPVDGTGGAPTGTLTRSTSSPLRGSASFLYTAGALGNGASYDFTIDAADQAQSILISFNWSATGTLADGDYTVYIYDKTNAVLSQLIPYKIGGAVANGYYPFKGVYQTASNSTSYRLIINQAVASPAGNVKFDNVYVGPQTLAYTDTRACVAKYGGSTQTITTTPSPIISPTLSIDTHTAYSNSTGLFTVPVTGIYRVGAGFYTTGAASGGANNGIYVSAYKNGSIVNQFIVDAADVSGTLNFTGFGEVLVPANAGDTLGAYISKDSAIGALSLQVTSYNWVSFERLLGPTAISQSDSSEGRVVAMSAYKTSTQSISNAGGYQAITAWSAIDKDTHTAFNITNGQYVVPVAGFYSVDGNIGFAANATSGRFAFIAVNGTTMYLGSSLGMATYMTRVTVSGSVYCNAGDIITVGADQTSGGALNIGGGNASDLRVTIRRLSGNPSASAAESVNARYSTAAGQSIPSGTATVINFGTVAYDSHGAVTTGAAWKYTAPGSGKYRVTSFSFLNDTTNFNGSTEYMDLVLYKNGAAFCNITSVRPYASQQYPSATGSTTISLLAGDYVDVRMNQTSGASLSLFSDGGLNWICIERVGN